LGERRGLKRGSEERRDSARDRLFFKGEGWEARLESGRSGGSIPDGKGRWEKEFFFAVDIRTLVDP
jgi:hypothetical protein